MQSKNNQKHYRPVKYEDSNYLQHIKQQHFLSACNALFLQLPNDKRNVAYVASRIAHSSAPRFYISPKQALREYNRYRHTHTLSANKPIIQEMYLEIFRRFDMLLHHTKGMIPYYAAMQQILEQPAPSFYLTPSAAKVYYYRAIHNRKKHQL